MGDCIYREKLLAAILAMTPKMDEDGYGWLGRRGVYKAINEFPAADVFEKNPVVMPFETVCRQCWHCESVGDGKNEPEGYECAEGSDHFGLPDGCYRYEEREDDLNG